ncbi:MAG: hypothetical protein MI861_16515, partial [Pirellulales bacterium]|nr:hypothetical protein [Pirellulales bacterium]
KLFNQKSYNIGHQDRSRLKNKFAEINTERLTFRQIQELIGDKPPVDPEKETSTSIRDQAYNQLESQTYQQGLLGGLKKKREINSDEINAEKLGELWENMTEDDHLRMDKSVLYVKADWNPKSKKPWRDSSYRYSFGQFFQWFFGVTRGQKFRRARNAVQNELATHLGTRDAPDHDLAKSVMKRVFKSDKNRAMKRADLRIIKNIAQSQNDLDDCLDSFKEKGKLHQVNTVTPKVIFNDLVKDRVGDGVAGMLQNYSQIHGRNIQRRVRVLNQIMKDLKTSESDVKHRATTLLNDPDLTPEGRRLCKELLGGNWLSRDDYWGYMGGGSMLRERTDLANELKKMIHNIVARELAEFRDDRKIAKYLGDNGFKPAVSEVDSSEVNNLSESENSKEMINTLADDQSPITQAFQLYCQRKGKSIVTVKPLAKFIRKMNDYIENRHSKQNDADWMNDFSKRARQIAENIKITDDVSRKQRDGARSANDTINRLIKGKPVALKDAKRLSETLTRSLADNFNDFQLEIPDSKPHIVNVNQSRNNSFDSQDINDSQDTTTSWDTTTSQGTTTSRGTVEIKF